jgi:heat shock protein HslJ
MRFAALAFLLLAACVPPATPGGTSQDASTTALLNKEWRLTSLGGAPSIKMQGERQPHVRFLPEGRLEGFGSCNGFSGSYELTGSGLRVRSVAATKMACADPALNRQESRFFGALESVSSYVIAAEELTLRSSSEELAKFQAAN